MYERLRRLLRRAEGIEGLPEDFLGELRDLAETPVQEDEQLIQEQRQHLRIFANNLPIFLAYIRRDGVIQFASRNYASFFGKLPEQMEGRRMEEVLPPPVVELQRASEPALFRAECVSVFDVAGPPEEPRHFHVHMIPHPSPRGEVIAFFVFVLEITEIQRANEARQSAEKQHREELQRLLKKEQFASRAKDQFLSSMSHELYTPLHGILQAVNAAMTEPLDTPQRQSLEALRAHATSLHESLKDLLELNRFEETQGEKTPVSFAPGELLQRIRESFQPACAEKNLLLSTELAPGCPDLVRADLDRVRRALSLLVKNAIKFTHLGQIEIFCGYQPASSEPARLLLSVQDTGIGIPLAEQGKIFDSFYQIDQSFSKKYGGSGLGLALCKRIVRLLGGTLRVKSEPGMGSTFLMEIPSKTPHFRTFHPPRRSPPRGGPCRLCWSWKTTRST